MTGAEDERPLMSLGHLAIPNVSAAHKWLEVEADRRAKAVEIVAEETSKWFGDFLPKQFYEQFAEKVVSALDQQT